MPLTAGGGQNRHEGVNADAIGAIPVGLEPDLRLQELFVSFGRRCLSVPDGHDSLRVSAQQVSAGLVQIEVDALVSDHIPLERK